MSYTALDAYGSVITVDSSIVSGVVQRPIVNIASILGPITATFSGSPSISGTVNVGNMPSVNAVITNLPSVIVAGSVFSYQAGTRITSISGVVDISGSVVASGTVGASIIGLTPVNVTNTNINVSGSIVAFGTVGASIIGLTPVAVSNFPTTQNVSGSVVAFVSGTVPVNAAGSVVAFQGAGWSGSVFAVLSGTPTVVVNNGSVVAFQGTAPWVIGSIVGTYAEDAASAGGDKGLAVLGVRNDAVASTAGTDLDYVLPAYDSAGRTLIKPFAAEESRIEGIALITSTSVTVMVASAGTGLKNYITDIFIANTGSVTTLITFKDGLGSILGYTIAPATGGSNIPGLATPMRTGAATTFDILAASPTSTLYATVKGFKAP